MHLIRSVGRVITCDLPELFRYVDSCHADESNLYFGDFIIFSAEGVQQGDPLGDWDRCSTVYAPYHSSDSRRPNLMCGLWMMALLAENSVSYFRILR